MRVYIEHYGCAANRVDAEHIITYLEQNGYTFSKDLESADMAILATCAVKGHTEARMFTRLKELVKIRAKNPIKIIVTGCLVPVQKSKLEEFEEVILIPPRDFNALETALNLSSYREEEIFRNHRRMDDYVAPILISEGCLGACTYCATKYARGNLVSFPIETILSDFKQAVENGYKDIWYTSQDTGVYGKDIGKNLIDLLKATLEVPGDYRLRVGMMNPNSFYINGENYTDELIELFKDERMYKFFHIPVQSGSDKVLREMKRPYTVKQFKDIFFKIRESIPDVVLSTDIIVGYATETEKDFQQTFDLIKETKPDIVNISRFTPRPHTEAIKLKPLDGKIVNARSKELTELVDEIILENNRKYIGRKERIFVGETGFRGNFKGRLSNYKPVILEEDARGKFVRVEIKDAFPTYLKGRIQD
ncbi:MAG: tRNA (N(6)-L-threonylcarbamoyladenosine(37)-C(2))-methylthiotransferase [Candidatus Diapherotrites archaeon]|nr:tRNA (N(6)-L-threonylcarbamoyladenosine(37)-C(2))-methylthiotransferase [Candidatus Diapherotrites archaeon]